MNNEIIEKIAERLAEIFPKITIYTENQKEGFKEPSFFINKTIDDVTPRLFEAQDRLYGYQIVYFANPKSPNADLANVEDILLNNFVDLHDYATIQHREFKPDSNEQTLVMNFDVFIRAFRVDNTKKFIGKVKVNVNGNNENNK